MQLVKSLNLLIILISLFCYRKCIVSLVAWLQGINSIASYKISKKDLHAILLLEHKKKSKHTRLNNVIVVHVLKNPLIIYDTTLSKYDLSEIITNAFSPSRTHAFQHSHPATENVSLFLFKPVILQSATILPGIVFRVSIYDTF